MHLYIVLQQDIGLKSPTLEGLGTLGTSAINVELAFFSNWPDLKKVLIAAVTSWPMIG